MIGIGINEYCCLSSDTKVNEKSTLELVVKQGNISESEKIRLSLEGKEVDERSIKLLQFPVQLMDGKGVKKSASQVLKEIQAYRNQLAKFLEVYMDSVALDKNFGATLPLEVSGADSARFENLLTIDSSILKIVSAISDRFIKLCIENSIFNSTSLFRLKLWRQTKEKAYPRLPVGFDMWIESMSVPTPKVTATAFDTKPYDEKYPLIHRLSNLPFPADTVPQEEINQSESLFNKKDEGVNEIFPDNKI